MMSFRRLTAAVPCSFRGAASSHAAVPVARSGAPMAGSSQGSCLMPSSCHALPARVCHWVGPLGHRALSTAAGEEKGKLKVLESMALALETSHGRQGRCEKVELPSDQGDLLGVWKLRVALDGENLLRFLVVLESSLNMKMAVGFRGELIEGMTAQQKLEWVNTWNRNKKWTKCSVDADGDSIALEYDVDLEKLSEPRAPAIQKAIRMFEMSLVHAAKELQVPKLNELMPEVDKLMEKLKELRDLLQKQKSAVERRSGM